MNSNNTLFPSASTPMSPASASLKIALLLLTGVSGHLSLTPPRTAAPKTVVSKGSLFERSVTWFTFCSKTLIWIMTLSDAAITYMEAYHSESSYDASGLVFDGSPVALQHLVHPLLQPSLLMYIGSFAVAFGAFIRLWCYRQLGCLFTFEITIQPNHALITSGPYGVVRHPSYTGIYLTLLGATAVAFAPGAYLRECWLPAWVGGSYAQSVWDLESDARMAGSLAALLLAGAVQAVTVALVTIWFVTSAYALRSTIKRLNFEDRELHRVFGKEWDAWAESVRWKLVPGIY